MIQSRVRAVLRRLGFGPAAKLLVIVPVYNVAEYLGECLASLRKQSFRNFTVVAVDDGSLDNSLEILREAAANDPRIRVVTQPNAGLGGARNRGLRHWRWLRWRRPPYVTFVDPDDILPMDAFENYFKSVQQTGSVMVVGSIERFILDVQDRWKPFWIKQSHRVAAAAVTIRERPDALRDIVACNRMVRRDFWDATNGLFPEDVAYEDHVPILRLYLAAPSFDMLTQTTYLWRFREDGTSIAQQKHDAGNLRDRFRAHEQGLADIHALGNPAAEASYIGRVLDIDLGGFVKRGVFADDEFRTVLLEFADLFVTQAQAHPQIWDEIPAHRATLAWLAATGDFETARTLTEIVMDEAIREYPVRNDGGALVLDLPHTDLTSAPAEIPLQVRRLTPAQCRLKAEVTAVGPDYLDVAVAVAAAGAQVIESVSLQVAATTPVTTPAATPASPGASAMAAAAPVAAAATPAATLTAAARRLPDGTWRCPLPASEPGPSALTSEPVPEASATAAGSTAVTNAAAGATTIVELHASALGIALRTRRFTAEPAMADKISEALGPMGWQWNNRKGQLRLQPQRPSV